ncbi:MAG TPA: matrixin family metalloprotease [Bryobacteraceae bacterium]|nr:matrixin family metalloprotease [Bryobacteraceae bacterium]
MRKLAYLLAGLLAAGVAGAQPALHLKGLRRDLTVGSAAPDAPLKTRTLGRSHLLVQFASQPGDDQVSELENRGATVLSYVPEHGLSISANDDVSFDNTGVQAVGRLQPGEKISPDLAAGLVPGAAVTVLAEFYLDVDPSDARAIANDVGLIIQEDPDLLSNHLMVSGASEQVLALAGWDEVAYIFPAAAELIAGTPMHACAGALTSQGTVGQSVALVGDGWDGPGLGSADLKYAWVHLTEKLPGDAAEAEIVRAFNEWAKYAKLTFSPSSNATGNQTIAVLFASGDHGDGYPFDGPGGVLAHTFYPVPINPEPIAGDMHFDNDENWKIGADVDVFSIALHETGHALGLGHSDKPGAVMYPYYHQVTGLTQEDIGAILQLYAAQDGKPNTGTPKPGTPSDTPTAPLTLTVQAPTSPTTASALAITGSTTGGSGNIQVSWTTNQGYSGAAQGSTSWTISVVPLNVGDNVVTITARDSQQSQATRSLTITRNQQPNPIPTNPTPGADTTPPSLTILSPATNNVSTSDSSLVVRGTAEDNVGVTSVTWLSSNGGSGTATGTTNWTTPAIPLYVGATTITIRASDAAGNTGWRSLTVTRN